MASLAGSFQFLKPQYPLRIPTYEATECGLPTRVGHYCINFDVDDVGSSGTLLGCVKPSTLQSSWKAKLLFVLAYLTQHPEYCTKVGGIRDESLPRDPADTAKRQRTATYTYKYARAQSLTFENKEIGPKNERTVVIYPRVRWIIEPLMGFDRGVDVASAHNGVVVGYRFHIYELDPNFSYDVGLRQLMRKNRDPSSHKGHAKSQGLQFHRVVSGPDVIRSMLSAVDPTLTTTLVDDVECYDNRIDNITMSLRTHTRPSFVVVKRTDNTDAHVEYVRKLRQGEVSDERNAFFSNDVRRKVCVAQLLHLNYGNHVIDNSFKAPFPDVMLEIPLDLINPDMLTTMSLSVVPRPTSFTRSSSSSEIDSLDVLAAELREYKRSNPETYETYRRSTAALWRFESALKRTGWRRIGDMYNLVVKWRSDPKFSFYGTEMDRLMVDSGLDIIANYTIALHDYFEKMSFKLQHSWMFTLVHNSMTATDPSSRMRNHTAMAGKTTVGKSTVLNALCDVFLPPNYADTISTMNVASLQSQGTCINYGVLVFHEVPLKLVGLKSDGQPDPNQGDPFFKTLLTEGKIKTFVTEKTERGRVRREVNRDMFVCMCIALNMAVSMFPPAMRTRYIILNCMDMDRPWRNVPQLQYMDRDREGIREEVKPFMQKIFILLSMYNMMIRAGIVNDVEMQIIDYYAMELAEYLSRKGYKASDGRKNASLKNFARVLAIVRAILIVFCSKIEVPFDDERRKEEFNFAQLLQLERHAYVTEQIAVLSFTSLFSNFVDLDECRPFQIYATKVLGYDVHRPPETQSADLFKKDTVSYMDAVENRTMTRLIVDRSYINIGQNIRWRERGGFDAGLARAVVEVCQQEGMEYAPETIMTYIDDLKKRTFDDKSVLVVNVSEHTAYLLRSWLEHTYRPDYVDTPIAAIHAIQTKYTIPRRMVTARTYRDHPNNPMPHILHCMEMVKRDRVAKVPSDANDHDLIVYEGPLETFAANKVYGGGGNTSAEVHMLWLQRCGRDKTEILSMRKIYPEKWIKRYSETLATQTCEDLNKSKRVMRLEAADTLEERAKQFLDPTVTSPPSPVV